MSVKTYDTSTSAWKDTAGSGGPVLLASYNNTVNYWSKADFKNLIKDYTQIVVVLKDSQTTDTSTFLNIYTAWGLVKPIIDNIDSGSELSYILETISTNGSYGARISGPNSSGMMTIVTMYRTNTVIGCDIYGIK